MAFVYEDGTATDVADWFTKLEAFLISAGWTVESGSGTQTVVFKSIGEGGGRTKLHVRFRQDGGTPRRVWHRVQDDVAGTHGTTESTISGYLDAGAVGATAFDYWMVADKDCVIVIFLTGTTYTGSYTGIVERFAVSISDEEKEMVACGLHQLDVTYCGYALMKWDGTWDCYITPRQQTTNVVKNPIDDSYQLFGIYVYEYASGNPNDRHLGQMKHVSNRLAGYSGLNAQDTIATGFGGATSWWTIFGTGTMRWAVHTGGALPTGAWEGGFSYTSGMASDINDLNAKFKAFLATHGWSEVTNPSPSYPIDYYLNSSGQLGGDDIWLRWYYNPSPARWGGYAMDDISDSHHTSLVWMAPAAGHFPLSYFIAGDGDCFLHGVEISSVWYWVWAGMFAPYLPDPSVFATSYKVGIVSPVGRYGLRNFDGTWAVSLTEMTDWWLNSSPNLIDGTSYIVWPNPLQYSAYPVGHTKYLHKLSSTAIAVNDTVTIGGRRYTYLGSDFAVRDQ